MAIFNSTILDGASGSVGNITLCKFKKKNVVRGKIVFKNKKKSAVQHAQQLRFKILAKLAYTFFEGAIVGFPGASWSHARSSFIKYNQKAVEIDEDTFETTVSLEQVVCSAGKLISPNLQACLQGDGHALHVKWFRQPLSPIAKDEDDLYIILLDTKQQKTVAWLIGKRGNPGVKELPLPKDFTSTNILAYTFAVSSMKKNTSDTVFVNLEHSRE